TQLGVSEVFIERNRKSESRVGAFMYSSRYCESGGSIAATFLFYYFPHPGFWEKQKGLLFRQPLIFRYKN
ncbi:MAG: hypothetical protein R6U51_10275, partial [Anaerolineales bacterium]